jgi:hypothetical protein
MAHSFESNIERAVGKVSDAEKERILHGRDESFNNQRFEDLRHKERPKTPTELEIIALANEVTNALRHVDGLCDFEVPPSNIHVIREENWPEGQKGNAFYDSECQAIALREQEANIIFFKKIVHEMIHFKSYNAVQVISATNPDVREYRVGLVVHARDGHAQYFNNLNEAVTEEITKEILATVKHPLLGGDVAQTEKVRSQYPHATDASGKPFFDDDTFYARLADETTFKNRAGRVFGKERSRALVGESFGYRRERDILRQLIQKLLRRNPQFKDVSEIHDLFRRGMITGDILPLGRLIDRTFGRGTLRRIGELDSDIDTQEKFVQSL